MYPRYKKTQWKTRRKSISAFLTWRSVIIARTTSGQRQSMTSCGIGVSRLKTHFRVWIIKTAVAPKRQAVWDLQAKMNGKRTILMKLFAKRKGSASLEIVVQKLSLEPDKSSWFVDLFYDVLVQQMLNFLLHLLSYAERLPPGRLCDWREIGVNFQIHLYPFHFANPFEPICVFLHQSFCFVCHWHLLVFHCSNCVGDSYDSEIFSIRVA